MTLPQDFIGVDIAKDWIDVHHLSTGHHRRIATTGPALAGFAREARGTLVVLEASGGYERGLMAALRRAGAPYARVNPRQARAYARATGRLAKTDRVDAEVLARMGRALELRPDPAPDPARSRLAALVSRREALAGMIRAEKTRATQSRVQGGDPWIRRQIAHLLRTLEAQRDAVEAEIEALVAASQTLTGQRRRLCSAPGVGPALSAVLLARLPELGTLDRRRIASLAGLAPQARDSGQSRGRRSVWGGRAELRRALYLAAFVASRWDPDLKAFRSRLEAASGSVKLAITACARKLLTILNAMVRDDVDFQSKPA